MSNFIQNCFTSFMDDIQSQILLVSLVKFEDWRSILLLFKLRSILLPGQEFHSLQRTISVQGSTLYNLVPNNLNYFEKHILRGTQSTLVFRYIINSDMLCVLCTIMCVPHVKHLSSMMSSCFVTVKTYQQVRIELCV